MASSRISPEWHRPEGWQTVDNGANKTAKVERTSRRKWRPLSITLALCLLVALLVLRLEQLDFMALRNTTTLPMLKLLGRPSRSESSTAEETFFYLPVAQGIAGIQARTLSQLAMVAGDTVEAERWLQAGVTDAASAELTYFELCYLYWLQGQDERAGEMCAAAPNSDLYWFNRGLEALTAGDQERALRAFRLAVKIDPTVGPAWMHVADLLLARGRYEEAIVAYDQVLATGSATAAVYSHLSQAYLALDQVEIARDILNQGLAAFPNERELYREIANTYRAEGDLAAADDWYARLLQRWSFDAYSWAARGEIALQQGEPRTAVIYYGEAVTYSPDGLGYWLGLATSAEEVGNVETAANAYEQTLALGPQEVAVWLRAGEFFAANGRIDQARIAFIGALNLQPDNQQAAEQLAALPQGAETGD